MTTGYISSTARQLPGISHILTRFTLPAIFFLSQVQSLREDSGWFTSPSRRFFPGRIYIVVVLLAEGYFVGIGNFVWLGSFWAQFASIFLPWLSFLSGGCWACRGSRWRSSCSGKFWKFHKKKKGSKEQSFKILDEIDFGGKIYRSRWKKIAQNGLDFHTRW